MSIKKKITKICLSFTNAYAPSACQLNGKILYCVQNNYAGNKKLVHRLIISSASKENKEVTIFQ